MIFFNTTEAQFLHVLQNVACDMVSTATQVSLLPSKPFCIYLQSFSDSLQMETVSATGLVSRTINSQHHLHWTPSSSILLFNVMIKG